MPYLSMNFLEKSLLPSSCAAAFEGPKTGMPFARMRSAAPSHSGASGPTTTKSMPFAAAQSAMAAQSEPGTSAGHSAICAMPGLPGMQNRRSVSGLSFKLRQIACSRPPLPSTRIFIIGGSPWMVGRNTIRRHVFIKRNTIIYMRRREKSRACACESAEKRKTYPCADCCYCFCAD